MPNNVPQTEALTPEQQEIESILSAQKSRMIASDRLYLEMAVVNGKRVIRSKVNKARLYIEVKPGQWEFPLRLDPNEAKLAHNPWMTLEDIDRQDEEWEALGWW